MKKTILYSIMIILFGCNSSQNNTSQIQKKEEVVLIFKDAPIQTREGQYGMRAEDPNGCIHYIDSTYTLCKFLPKDTGYDTLKIPAFNGYANLSHTYKVCESIRYYFTAGDTILFTYNQSGRPNAQSRTNSHLTRYYNLEENMPGHLFETTGYSNIGVLGNMFLINTFAYFKTNAAKQFPTLKSKYEKAYLNLDSVEVLYHSHVRNLHDSLNSLLKQHIINKTQYRFSLGDSKYNDSLVRFFHDRRYRIKNNGKVNPPTYNDSLASYLNYQYDLHSYALRISSGSSGENPIDGFNALLKQTIPPLSKQIMLRYLISMMSEYDAQQAKSAYLTHTHDSLYYGKIQEITVSQKNILANGYTNDFILKSTDGEIVKYDELLQKHTGKVIYVDFWASWCAPCMQEMPASIKLHHEYKNKDIIFIYLAYNDKEENWKQALNTTRLAGLAENYLIINCQSANMVKELQLNTIPRYLLYNSGGKLKVSNAPRPSSDNIKKEIDKLLIQK